MTGEISQSNQDPPYHLSAQYSARVQDGQQEMERNEATAKHVAWPNCAWLLLRFFPFPVGHSVAAHSRMTPSRHPVALQKEVSSFYYHDSLSKVTKPESTSP